MDHEDHLTWKMHAWGRQPHHMLLLTVVRLPRHKKAFERVPRALYCPGGNHRYPVHSPLQEGEQFWLPLVEDGNLSHGVRFCWDSFLVPPNRSTQIAKKLLAMGRGGERSHNSHFESRGKMRLCIWSPRTWTSMHLFSLLACPMVDWIVMTFGPGGSHGGSQWSLAAFTAPNQVKFISLFKKTSFHGCKQPRHWLHGCEEKRQCQTKEYKPTGCYRS